MTVLYNALAVLAFLVLTAGTAVFVAAEFSLTALERSTVEANARTGGRRDQLVLRAHRTLSFQLSGAQVGISITTLITGYLAEPLVARLLEPVFAALSIPQKIQATPPSGNVLVADFFEHLSAVQAVGRNNGDSVIMERSQSVLFDFYQNASTHSSVEFRKSPYADFFIAQSHTDFSDSTANLSELFEEKKKKIFQIIDVSEAEFPSGSDAVDQVLRRYGAGSFADD